MRPGKLTGVFAPASTSLCFCLLACALTMPWAWGMQQEMTGTTCSAGVYIRGTAPPCPSVSLPNAAFHFCWFYNDMLKQIFGKQNKIQPTYNLLFLPTPPRPKGDLQIIQSCLHTAIICIALLLASSGYWLKYPLFAGSEKEVCTCVCVCVCETEKGQPVVSLDLWCYWGNQTPFRKNNSVD